MLGFIINPVSGNGKGALVWEQVQAELHRRGVRYLHKVTQQAGETVRLAQQLLDEPNLNALITIGGDGTAHEAVNAIYLSGRLQTIRFGLIPAGTGNDFAREHDLPSKPLDVLNLILEKNSQRPIDLFQMEGKVAVNCIGIGFDAVVANHTNKAAYKNVLNKLKLGKVAYFISAIRAYFSFRPFSAVISSDGSEQRFSSVWMIVNSNVPYFGGGMKVCPHAVCDDGDADIIIFHSKSRARLLSIFQSIYTGKHIGHPAVSIMKGKQFRITTDIPQQIQADGEPIEPRSSFQYQVLPKQLFVIQR